MSCLSIVSLLVVLLGPLVLGALSVSACHIIQSVWFPLSVQLFDQNEPLWAMVLLQQCNRCLLILHWCDGEVDGDLPPTVHAEPETVTEGLTASCNSKIIRVNVLSIVASKPIRPSTSPVSIFQSPRRKL